MRALLPPSLHLSCPFCVLFLGPSLRLPPFLLPLCASRTLSLFLFLLQDHSGSVDASEILSFVAEKKAFKRCMTLGLIAALLLVLISYVAMGGIVFYVVKVSAPGLGVVSLRRLSGYRLQASALLAFTSYSPAPPLSLSPSLCAADQGDPGGGHLPGDHCWGASAGHGHRDPGDWHWLLL